MRGELRFDGEVAIVTGAGRGLGREHAMLLAARGAKVVVNDRGGSVDGSDACSDPAVAEDVVTEIEAAGGEAVANTESVADPDGPRRIVDHALAAFGRVDALINNAGIFERRAFPDVSRSNLDSYLATNLVGSIAMCLAVWPEMTQQGYGRIVNTQSSAGILGMADRVPYGASKTGILGLTRCLARDGADRGIKVNLVNPSGRTRMWLEPDGRPSPDVPALPLGGLDDDYLPSLVSPIFAVLSHPSCPVSGEMFNCGAGNINRQFIANTKGYTSHRLTPEAIVENWADVVDEEGYFVPTPFRPYRDAASTEVRA